MIKNFFTRLKNKISGPSYGKISYSQCGEDVIIAHLFNNLSMDRISYLDIGAHHPHYLSNTAYFYKRGNRGINVEPDPRGFAELTKHRKEDVNINWGVADKDGKLDFYVMNVPTLNTFSKDEAEKLEVNHGFKIVDKLTIDVYSVSTILKKYNNGKFPELLSLDVEGLDQEIIKSLTWETDKPLVICLETISYSNTGKGKKNIDTINYLIEMGYMVYADTYINTIFVLRSVWIRK